MEYEKIATYEKMDIKHVIFSKTDALDKKVMCLLSAAHQHEVGFYIELYKEILAGNDKNLQLGAIRIVPEFMQARGTALGADLFISTILTFIEAVPDQGDEIREILSEALEFKAMFSENQTH